MIMQQEKQSTRAAAMGSNDVRAGTTPPQPDDQSREDLSARPACGDEVALAPMAASRTKPETNAQNGRTIARRVLAVGALLLGCGLAVASNWIDPLRVCETVSGGDPLTVVNVCNPWSEFELVPFLLVGLLFLSPDLSELSVLSLVTLKREVKAQQTELEATAQRQDALEMSLSAQISSLESSQTMTNSVYILSGSAAQLPEQVREKEDLVRSEGFQYRTSRGLRADDKAEGSPLSSQGSAAALQLLKEWEELQPFTDIGQRSHRSPRSNYVDTDRIVRWNAVFRDEIARVRAIRNALAHGQPVTSEDIHGALDATRQLRRLLHETA